MKKSIVIFLLLINLLGNAQANYNADNYNVTRNDIELNTYEKDSTANALVLYEFGNSHVDRNDFNLITEEKHKVKILNREGFDKANITIYLYNDEKKKQKVKNVVATTYNLIGGEVIKTKLEEKDIFEETYNDHYTLVKFALPNIKEGSVITYSYTVTSPFMFKYKGWDFQDDIPKLYSEYKTSIPGNWLYNIKLVGGKKLTVNTTDIEKNCLEVSSKMYSDCSNSVYAMKDIPAFIEEDYMTSKSNYLARIEYELGTMRMFDGRVYDYTKTWKTVDKELKSEPSIGRQLTKSIDREDFISNTIINEKDLLKKASAIYRYVQDNYTWNGDYNIFDDVSLKELIENKTGNVSAINILLHNLLQACDVPVKPVLLSTRDNGFPTKVYPVISDFNYLIVQATINNKTYLLDATDEYLSFGEIPFDCLNSFGRLLDFEKGSDWIDIVPDKISTVQYKVELTLGPEGSFSGNVNSKTTGYHALNSKKAYYPNTEAYINHLEDKYLNLEIANHQVTSEGKTSFDFSETYNISYHAEDTGGNIYLNPFFVKFFKENPFKLQERSYPIDFGYKDTYYYLLKLDFGDSYTVEETPKDATLSLPNNKGNIVFSSNLKDNVVNLLFKISFSDAIYEPEYYPYLKGFMSNIVDIQTNSLILLKKK